MKGIHVCTVLKYCVATARISEGFPTKAVTSGSIGTFEVLGISTLDLGSMEYIRVKEEDGRKLAIYTLRSRSYLILRGLESWPSF